MHTTVLMRSLWGVSLAVTILSVSAFAQDAAKTQLQAPKPEIAFDAGSQTVTVKMLVQDPNGYFIPNIRRENFAVYENGVRQENAGVSVEHSPVSVGVLMESGGRYQALNRALGEEVTRSAHQFLNEIGPADKIALWQYADTLEQLAAFTDGHDTLDRAILTAKSPFVSETNFYDALIAALARMQPLQGRKALLVLSSGLDTFSKADYQAVLRAVRESGIPVYAINLGPALQQHGLVSSGPYVALDWKRAEAELKEIAETAGGRLYSPQNTFDLSGIYDDLMENLRVRYVITYKSTATDPSAARTVRVDLVDSRTGGPLEIVDANGRTVRARISVENSYFPGGVSSAAGKTSPSRPH